MVVEAMSSSGTLLIAKDRGGARVASYLYLNYRQQKRNTAVCSMLKPDRGYY